ncbi:hypothetical protein B1757_12910 [Acidithiobacillus marinus]|uniref:Uncharacterized protein n=1 Tax=Acidithiobacillus marinus TaxID=187490 RepID=A0A2I1DIZ3_9PROT|nr:hypothetical protein [Acidithiobacillus marinus]PKY09843.1 hypothetical protein B1757_12910 [Acidithiobacillus marinus]
MNRLCKDTGRSHAVRWAQRKKARAFTMQYSKWHWTVNAAETLCGTQIPIITSGAGQLPEASDDEVKVTCKRCLKQIKKADIKS